MSASYEYSVFVNCPFDDAYRPLFESIVFAIHDCGYIARCALEIDDASQVRIEKIATIIAACRFGIHDISRTEPDAVTNLPRFNMPLELGMFLGAKRYGRAEQKQKSCLILDVERYRFQKFISDIAGQDIAAHGGEPSRAIRAVRDWLSNATPKSIRIPGGAMIARRYDLFRMDLPAMCERLQLSVDELTFNNYVVQVEEWLKLNSRVAD
jgi:hypothetical protein